MLRAALDQRRPGEEVSLDAIDARVRRARAGRGAHGGGAGAAGTSAACRLLALLRRSVLRVDRRGAGDRAGHGRGDVGAGQAGAGRDPGRKRGPEHDRHGRSDDPGAVRRRRELNRRSRLERCALPRWAGRRVQPQSPLEAPHHLPAAGADPRRARRHCRGARNDGDGGRAGLAADSHRLLHLAAGAHERSKNWFAATRTPRRRRGMDPQGDAWTGAEAHDRAVQHESAARPATPPSTRCTSVRGRASGSCELLDGAPDGGCAAGRRHRR